MPAEVSLDDLLQDLAEETGRRLVLLDTGLRVVGYSIHETEADRTRLGHILAHSDTWDRPAIPASGHASITVPRLSPSLFLSIGTAQRPMGYLLATASGGRPEREVLPVLLAATAGLGGQLLLRERRQQARWDRAGELVAQLLGPNPRQRSRAARTLVEEGLLGASAQYSAVAVGQDPAGLPAGADNGRGVALTMEFVARSTTASVAGGVFQDVGVLVFPRPVVVDRLARLLCHPEETGLRAGIGPLVPSLDRVPESFVRARAAWRAAYLADDRQPPVLRWSESGVDGMLGLLPLESFGLADLPEPLRPLWETGPDPVLVQTLETYLDCGGDARATARRLNIHRSTFYYRLDRLRAVLRVELGDGCVRRELHTGLRLARLARL